MCFAIQAHTGISSVRSFAFQSIDIEPKGGNWMLQKYVLSLSQLVALLLTAAICVYFEPLRVRDVMLVAIVVFTLTNALAYLIKSSLKAP